MNTVPFIIAGMVAVTYIPRLLPLILRRGTDPPAWVTRTLQLLPYTAIGALIVPDAFSSVPGGETLGPAVGGPVAAGAGLLAAVVITWTTRQPFLAVIGAVLVVAGVQLIV